MCDTSAARGGAAHDVDHGPAGTRTESAYSELHRTKPHTLGYGLLDSPVALCAWLVEKFWTWTDHPGDLERVLSRDQVLDASRPAC